MSQEEIVSVILPTHNSKNLLHATIKSVLRQTYPDFELLIIDDCSTDKETLDLLNDYARKDERIQFIFNDKRMGIDQARNLAVTFAGGKYLTFIHPGDSFSSTFLEHMVNLNEANATDLAICHVDSYQRLNQDICDNNDYTGHIPRYWLESSKNGEVQKVVSRDTILKNPCQIFNSHLSQGKLINLECYKKAGLAFREIYGYSDADWAMRVLLAFPQYSLDPVIGVCSLSTETLSILRLSESLVMGLCEIIKQRYNVLCALDKIDRAKKMHLLQSLQLYVECAYHHQGSQALRGLKARCLAVLQSQGYSLEEISWLLPRLEEAKQANR